MPDGARIPRRAKSVRWTQAHGEAPPPSPPGSPPGSPHAGSGGRGAHAHAHAAMPAKVYVESDESSSETETDDDVAQTTRTNTWINRLRALSDDSDSEEGITISVPPRIHVSMPSANPFAHLMDIGTRTSGGLAPGTAANAGEDENRSRRNRLVASSARSQPTSPQLAPLDARDAGAIPLQDLPVPPPPELENLDASAQAEVYRKKVEHEQQKRQQAISRILAKQSAGRRPERRDSQMSQASQASQASHSSRNSRNSAGSNHSGGSQSSHGSHGSHGGSSDAHGAPVQRVISPRRPILRTRLGSLEEDSESDEEKKHLKDLEEASKKQAEEHARQLVSQHMQPVDQQPTDAGYVRNQDLELNLALDDDDLSAIDTDEDDHTEEEKKEDVSDTESSEMSVHQRERESTLRGDPDYVPPPKKVKEGVLGSLLRLYAGQDDEDDKLSMGSTATSPADSPMQSPLQSPLQTPMESDGQSYLGQKKRPSYLRTYSSEDALGRESKGRPKWYQRSSLSHVPSLQRIATSGRDAADAANTHIRIPLRRTASGKVHAVQDLAQDAAALGHRGMENLAALRDKDARKRKKKIDQQRKEKEKALKKARLAEQARITVHIADVLQRQRFLLRLGRALMLFGAPSHRLEEYLKITSRVLEIDAQVLYIPGCMLISFGDATTHTSETKLLRVTQGLNLGKLHATHLLYKEVVHDLMGLEEASSHIDHLLTSKDLYPWWLVVIFYGIACLSFGMYSYGGYWNDLPILFVVGAAVGFLQFWVQPRSDLYSNVFEVSSSIIVSFIGRAIGSIGTGNNRVFCFAAIVQGSLSLILPGYIILVGALELQTKNLVAGSVRMFYANIYSLFLSFGITLGSAIYGWIDKTASGETTCHRTIDAKWRILFVPAATAFIAAVNQASPRQLPVMVVVGCSGYCVLYFVQLRVPSASAFTSAIGAFTIGILGNLYSRVGHGLAFAAMLPGIFCLVPSGVAAQGSLVAGVAYANAIVESTNSTANATSTEVAEQASNDITQLGSTMTQVAVGIVVGLFAATLFVYPLGFKKKRSGLFTF